MQGVPRLLVNVTILLKLGLTNFLFPLCSTEDGLRSKGPSSKSAKDPWKEIIAIIANVAPCQAFCTVIVIVKAAVLRNVFGKYVIPCTFPCRHCSSQSRILFSPSLRTLPSLPFSRHESISIQNLGSMLFHQHRRCHGDRYYNTCS